METNTYITQIAIGKDKDKENEAPTQQKFLRHIISEGRSQNGDFEPLKKVRSSNQAIMKDANSFLPDEYYAMKKVKPRMYFYRTILEVEERRKTEPNLPVLRINMSESLVLLEHELELIYSDKGVVKVRSEQSLNEFIRIVKPSNKKFIPTEQRQELIEKQEVQAAVLMGVGTCAYTDFSIALANELDSRILPKNQNQVSIKFIQPFGDYPNLLRLFYRPKNIKNTKPNYAYKAMNKKKLSDQILQRKYKQIHHYIVDFNKDDNIVTTLVRGKALQEVQAMTQSIIDYLEEAKKVKITEMVVDYIFAENRLYYLHEIKSIKSVNLSNIWDIGTTEQKQQKYKEQTNQIYCRLCCFSFPKIQMTKQVTNKLITELLLHLQNRGLRPFGNFSSKLTNLSSLSNVCNLCYELIVAENRLISVENEFCATLNVRSEEIVKGIANRRAEGEVVGGEDLQMMQWRMFLYVEKVKNVGLGDYQGDWNFGLNMKFSDFRETFVKKLDGHQIFDLSRARSSKTYMNKKILQSKTSLNPNNRLSRHDKKSTLHTSFTNRSNLTFPKQNNIDFQKIRLLTFYTKTQDISQVLMNEQLTFQLCFSNKKYKGHSSTLQNFTNKKQCQRHSCQVLLFGNQYQYCNLELNVGLVCDGPIPTSSLVLTKSGKQTLYYCADNCVRNCTPLPAEWIETISQGLVLECPESPRQQQVPLPQTKIFRIQSGRPLSHTQSQSIRKKKTANLNINQDKNQQFQYL